MEKIVFFGDSFTYGFGLDPKWDDQHKGPNPQGWANLLGEMRNASCRNLSRIGSSNLRILWSMLNTEIEPDEIIIVQWSFWDRDCLLDDKIVKILPRFESSMSYFELHSTSDLIRRNWLNIHHGLMWLKQQPNHFLMLGDEYDYRGDMQKNHAKFKKYETLSDSDKNIIKLTDKMIPYYFNQFWCDTAADNEHAGPNSNIKWANFINGLLDSKLKG